MKDGVTLHHAGGGALLGGGVVLDPCTCVCVYIVYMDQV